MISRRRIDVRIEVRQDNCHGTAGGQSGDEDGVAAKAELSHQVFCQRRQNAGLAHTVGLMGRLEPVPARARIVPPVLRRIGNGKPLLVGQRVHVRADGEVVRGLRAAVQHEDQPLGPLWFAGGQIEFVFARSRGAAVLTVQILRTLRDAGHRNLARPGRLGRLGRFGRLDRLRHHCFERGEGRCNHEAGHRLFHRSCRPGLLARAHQPAPPAHGGS